MRNAWRNWRVNHGWPWHGLAPGDPRHGTHGGYVRYGCRCPACTQANTAASTAYRRSKGVRTRDEYTAARRANAADYHGTEWGYTHKGCREACCRTAAAAGRRERRQRAKEAA